MGKELENLVVTGVAGFLGSHLSEQLVKMGYNVKGVDNLSSGYKDNIPHGIEFHKVDCRDFVEMSKIMQGVDAVYHCAAYPYEGVSVFSPSIVTDNTFQATTTTLSAFIKNKGKRFIFCSSMARYGMNQTPFSEDMPTRPQDPYAIAKVSSEEQIKLMSRVHGFDYVIAVPHNIYGPKQIYNDPFRNVAAIFANKMLKGENPIIYGDGNQRRCLSYIKDDLPPLISLLEENHVIGETFNIGPDEEFVSINHLAETIANIIGFDLDPVYLPDRPQEVRDANCSANKARRLLNYKTKYTLKEGLEEMIDWIRIRGTREFNYKHLEIEILNEKTPKSWSKRLI